MFEWHNPKWECPSCGHEHDNNPTQICQNCGAEGYPLSQAEVIDRLTGTRKLNGYIPIKFPSPSYVTSSYKPIESTIEYQDPKKTAAVVKQFEGSDFEKINSYKKAEDCVEFIKSKGSDRSHYEALMLICDSVLKILPVAVITTIPIILLTQSEVNWDLFWVLIAMIVGAIVLSYLQRKKSSQKLYEIELEIKLSWQRWQKLIHDDDEPQFGMSD